MPTLTAVTIPDMRTTFFVANFSRDSLPKSEDSTGWPIEVDVQVDVPPDLYSWPEGTPAPEPEILCRSKINPSYYRVFKWAADVPQGEYERTGRAYGGFYTESHWAGLMKLLPGILEFCRIPDLDQPQVPELSWEPVQVGH